MVTKMDFNDLPKNWKAYIGQIRWERDMAINQLESYGVQFGENADVVRVIRCKDCKFYNNFIEGESSPNIICFQMHPNDYCNYALPKEK